MTKKEKKSSSLSNVTSLTISSSYVFVFSYKSTTAEQMYALRKSLFDKTGDRVVVAKNSVINVAIKSLSLPFFSNKISGQNAFIFTQNPIEASSILEEFQSKTPVKILLASDKAVDFDESFVLKMAKYKTQDGLKSAFLSLLKEPVSSIVRLLSKKAV